MKAGGALVTGVNPYSVIELDFSSIKVDIPIVDINNSKLQIVYVLVIYILPEIRNLLFEYTHLLY